MKSKINITTGRLAQFGLLVVALFGYSMTASAAGTASNTTLTNTVSVDYTNISGSVNATETASATIIIELVKAAPDLASNSAATFNDISEGENVTINFQVTTNANGPDDYDLDFTESLTDLSASDISAADLPTNVNVGYLGASTVGVNITFQKATSNDCLATAAGTAGESTGTCSIDLPNDVSGAWTGVNGIDASDTIEISGANGTLFCDVVSINNNGNQGEAYTPTTNSSTIVIQHCGTDLANRTELGAATYDAEVGYDVSETKEISVTFTIGDAAAATAVTVITGTATDVGNTVASGGVATTINVLGTVLEIYKYVRNVDDAFQTGTDAAAYDILDINGTKYYRTGITAAPGETLEYAILLLNKGGQVQNLVATDPIVPFTSYNTTFRVVLYPSETITDEACTTNNECVVTFTTNGGAGNTSTDDTLTTNTDFAGLNSGVITVYPGTGGNENGAVGGTIAAGNVSYFLYRLTVDN